MTQETTTKHDSSPPRGDRAELDTAPVEPQERRIVLRMANGSFFRGFRPRGRGGGAVSVQRLGQARLFAPGSRALEQARSKLRPLGVDVEPEEVIVKIGETQENRRTKVAL